MVTTILSTTQMKDTPVLQGPGAREEGKRRGPGNEVAYSPECSQELSICNLNSAIY